MAFFKIGDIRVRFTHGSDYRLYVDGLGVGDPVDMDAPTVRAAAMAQVFQSGRDCWWRLADRAFTTNPVPESRGDSPLNEGVVEGWDITIPASAGSSITIDLELADASGMVPTSGAQPIGWASMTVSDADLLIVLMLLQSPYCYYASGTLRNSDLNVV